MSLDRPDEPTARSRPMEWDGAACRQAFAEASAHRPWTVGFESFNALQVESDGVQVDGQWPPTLRGVLYRNGPGRHEVGGWRYGHRWDGDGLVQAFDFRQAKPGHRAAYVRTHKLRSELAAGGMLYSGFGTKVPGSDPLTRPMDQMNAANISVLPLRGELLALWEPGSAYSLDPETLETNGIKSFAADIDGLPFSAHPKVEPYGTVWNFGTDPIAGHLHLYAIEPTGVLKVHRCLRVDQLPPAHDFAITERHLVFVLPPLIVSEERIRAGASFAHSCTWQPRLGLRILVVSKHDFSVREYRLPPGNLFHVGNAWEDDDGVIRFDMMRSEDPRSLVAGWSIMRGEYRHAASAFLTLVELGKDGGAEQSVVSSLEGEFPSVDPRRVGRRHDTVLCVARSRGRASDVVGYDQIALFMPDSGAEQRYTYGDDFLVEEHLLVPDSRQPAGPARWVIGTALDMKRRRTVCSVFDARSISAGPVAQAWLPYAMPLGLHGAFVCSAL